MLTVTLVFLSVFTALVLMIAIVEWENIKFTLKEIFLYELKRWAMKGAPSATLTFSIFVLMFSVGIGLVFGSATSPGIFLISGSFLVFPGWLAFRHLLGKLVRWSDERRGRRYWTEWLRSNGEAQ